MCLPGVIWKYLLISITWQCVQFGKKDRLQSIIDLLLVAQNLYNIVFTMTAHAQV